MSTPCFTYSWATRVSLWLGRGAGGMRSRLGPGGQGGPAQLHVPPASTGFSRDYRDDVAERLLTLKDGLVHPDPAILFHTCHSIAQVPARHPQRGGHGLG